MFQLVDFGTLRSYIDRQFSDLASIQKFPYNLESLIDDFILMLFLCGNDFLPALPTLDIGEGALDYFFTLYKNMISQLDGYIVDTQSLSNANNNNNIIHFDRLQVFLQQVASIEKHVLNERLWALTRQYPNYERFINPPAEPSTATEGTVSPPESLNSSQDDMELVEEENLVIQNKFINLYNCLDLKQCECLNAKSSTFQSILQNGSTDVIESDSDEQLLIKLSFKEKVKLHSLVVLGEDQNAPARVKLFVNKPDIQFGDVDNEPPKQTVAVKYFPPSSEEEDILQKLTPVDFLKFQNISHLCIFVDKNHGNLNVTKVTQILLFGVPLAGLNMAQLKKVPRWRKKKSGRRFQHRSPGQISDKRRQQITSYLLLHCVEEVTEKQKTVNFGKWRDLYYRTKMKIDCKDEQGLLYLVTSYCEGLQWTFEYYFRGCPSWTWFYPFYYAPLASDVVSFPADLIQKNIRFDLGRPCTPFEQLVSVLPPSSAHLLPMPYRSLMTDTNSPLAEFFPKSPEDLVIDKEGKRYASEYIVCVPFLDANRLEAAMSSIKDSDLTEEERIRNPVGSAMLYEYSQDGTVQISHLTVQ